MEDSNQNIEKNLKCTGYDNRYRKLYPTFRYNAKIHLLKKKIETMNGSYNKMTIKVKVISLIL